MHLNCKNVNESKRKSLQTGQARLQRIWNKKYMHSKCFTFEHRDHYCSASEQTFGRTTVLAGWPN